MIDKESECSLLRMADWFQYATTGAVLHRFSPYTDEAWTLPRATGPRDDLTYGPLGWGEHALIHGPVFRIKTYVSVTHTARKVMPADWDFSVSLKSETFERHALSCAHAIIFGVGSLATHWMAEEKCETCGHIKQVPVDTPEMGSGFFERVGRMPDFENDRWRLFYIRSRLLKFVRGETGAYFDSEFRLMIDSAGGVKGEGGRPYYWRLDPRPWYRT